MFFILESYSSVRWRIENLSRKSIAGIAYGSYEQATTVELASSSEDVPNFAISDGLRGGSNYNESAADVQQLLGNGRSPDEKIEEYGTAEIKFEWF